MSDHLSRLFDVVKSGDVSKVLKRDLVALVEAAAAEHVAVASAPVKKVEHTPVRSPEPRSEPGEYLVRTRLLAKLLDLQRLHNKRARVRADALGVDAQSLNFFWQGMRDEEMFFGALECIDVRARVFNSRADGFRLKLSYVDRNGQTMSTLYPWRADGVLPWAGDAGK